jgi:hypothetical protein
MPPKNLIKSRKIIHLFYEGFWNHCSARGILLRFHNRVFHLKKRRKIKKNAGNTPGKPRKIWPKSFVKIKPRARGGRRACFGQFSTSPKNFGRKSAKNSGKSNEIWVFSPQSGKLLIYRFFWPKSSELFNLSAVVYQGSADTYPHNEHSFDGFYAFFR